MPLVDVHALRREIKRFDPVLDFDWNNLTHAYEVTGVDRKGQKYLIYRIQYGDLDQVAHKIIKGLYEATPHRQGGAEAMNRMLDDIEQRRNEFEEQQWQQQIEDMTKEAYDHLKRRDGYRVNNAGVPGGEGFTVVDRRRVTLDSVSPSDEGGATKANERTDMSGDQG